MDEALRSAAARFAAVSDTPRLDAELLLAHALGLNREALLLGPRDRAVPAAFAALVERRAAGEPIAYIIGTRDFWTITLAVTPAVLIPRADSETLIEAAVAHFAGTTGPHRILDLGTGSGALLLAALDQWREASGLGVDRSAGALAVAAGNAERLGMAGRATFVESDWAEGIEEQFDLILCNPPYVATGASLGAGVVEYEPAGALFAGAEGLDDYRRLAPMMRRLIGSGGLACIEIGADQADSAGALFAAHGLSVALRHDLGGRPRCLMLRRDEGIL